MAIGIVSDDEFDAELESIKETPTRVEIIEKQKKGRSENDVNVPDVIRNIIGEDHLVNGRTSALALAETFGVSKQSASAYANGATSTKTYNEPNKKLGKHLEKVKNRIKKTASQKLEEVLTHVTSDKMEAASLRTLTGAARDLAGVVKDISPSDESDLNGGSNTPKFILYAPQFVQENNFETIVVQE